MKILFVSPADLYSTPRLIRNAFSLAGAGHEVNIMLPYKRKEDEGRDLAIALPKNCSLLPIRLYGKNGMLSFQWKTYKKIAAIVYNLLKTPRIAGLSMAYGIGKMRRELASLEPDLIIAQQHPVAPISLERATSLGIPLFIDMEDVLSEEPSSQRLAAKQIEETCLSKATRVLTMSNAAANFFDTRYSLKSPSIALHNSTSPLEKEGFSSYTKAAKGVASIYWFGKTIGPHSCALELLHANLSLGAPFHIALRGKLDPVYCSNLAEVAAEHGASSTLSILEPQPIEQMLSLASEHDIFYGSQPPGSLFHELAIGNKIFTGLQAGMVMLVQDTEAHRLLFGDMKKGIFYYDLRVENSLRNCLQQIFASTSDLKSFKIYNREASKQWSWNRESRRLIDAVNSLQQYGHRSRPQSAEPSIP
jgi:hypothetical protein